MRKVSVNNWSGTKPAQQRRQAQAVELRNAQRPRAQKLIGCRLRNEGQAGRQRDSGLHANVRAPITDCSSSGVMHSFLERIAASAARDNSSLTAESVSVRLALMA